jgi:hypothetical protein
MSYAGHLSALGLKHAVADRKSGIQFPKGFCPLNMKIRAPFFPGNLSLKLISTSNSLR